MPASPITTYGVERILQRAEEDGVLLFRRKNHIRAYVPVGQDREWWVQAITTFRSALIWKLPRG